MEIRYTERGDINGLKAILDQIELFPSDMLEDMLNGFLEGDTDDLWLTLEASGSVLGFCYAVPEQLADGAWNILALGVDPKRQGSGAGAKLTAQMEAQIEDQDGRIIIVDTSGTEAFTNTRRFYEKAGFVQEARIRDFWAKGDDKVTFWKTLG
jgi:ribosomal protein S18 acetylase RimI-like enzyme